jgi:hypothetical protein
MRFPQNVRQFSFNIDKGALSRDDDLREHASGGWGKLHNEKLRNLYYSPDIVRVISPMRATCFNHLNLTQIIFGKEYKL